jgi:predicted AlkP superfamily phosphohydrolase/phosphomutase
LKHAKRTLIVGLDGACWPYLSPLMEDGRLPTLQNLVVGGAYGELESTMPPVTPVAWTSFATGKNPGKHGIFSWLWRRPGTWEFLPFSGTQRVGTPWWQYLNKQGIRVGLVNIPMTYPPASIEGFTICGFGAPANSPNLTYPASLLHELKEGFGWSGDSLDGDISDSDGGWHAFEVGKNVQDQNVRIALHLADQYAVDVLAINLMLLDHCNHLASDQAVLEEAIVQCDRHLSALMDGFNPDNVLVFSDHGSRRVKGSFLLGLWLHDHGYLRWKKRRNLSKADLNWLLHGLLKQYRGWDGITEKWVRALSRELLSLLPEAVSRRFWKMVGARAPILYEQYRFEGETDFSRSPVHLEDWGTFYLNTATRNPGGFLSLEDCEQIRQELSERLLDICDPDTNDPLISRIYRSDELYKGQLAELAPDLALDYFSSQWSLTKGFPANVKPRARYFILPRERWNGDHTWEGMFVFSGDLLQSNSVSQAAHIMDVPTTLLYMYGCSIPEDWDGKVLLELIEAGYVGSHKPTTQPGDDPAVSASDYDYSEQEIAQISARLRSLGYLD